MKLIRTATAALALCLPMLAGGMQAEAATASQYSAHGHGRHATMTNRPSRMIYHRGHRRMRHHR